MEIREWNGKDSKEHRLKMNVPLDFAEDLKKAIEISKDFGSKNPEVFVLKLEESGESSWKYGDDLNSIMRIKDIKRIYDR